MGIFSPQSRSELYGCHAELQKVFERVVGPFDCTILEGYRTPDRQAALFKAGKSKIKNAGHHNCYPSEAVDASPYPVRWPKRPGFITRLLLKPVMTWAKDYARFYYFAGYVLGTADQMFRGGEIHHRLRWGGDWDSDRDIHDQNFDDLPHFEIVEV
jgi:peptidoglycan L-alanyl-D-glutamate endopeptidase CwlK